MRKSIKRTAQIGGALYLLIILAGLYGEMFVRAKLVVPGNPSATFANVAAHPLLWRTGIAADLLMQLLDVPVMLVWWLLLKPISKPMVGMAIIFNIVQTAVLALNKLILLVPLFLTGSEHWLAAFQPQQLQVLTQLSVRLHGYGFGIGLLFFGCECLILGWLIYRAAYFPKFLGILMFFTGCCYLVNSFALVLSPDIAEKLFPAILLPCFVGELSMSLWLLVMGINSKRWQQYHEEQKLAHAF